MNGGEAFLASDVPAILKYTRNVYYVDNLQIAMLEKGGVTCSPFKTALRYLNSDASSTLTGTRAKSSITYCITTLRCLKKFGNF